MELSLKKSDLLKGLYIAHGVADRKSVTPIVANVLIRSEGKNSILCAATDLKIHIAAQIPATVKKEGGVSLGAKHLYEIVRNLPDEMIKIEKGDNNWVEITSGTARYKLVGSSDRDFPKLPDHREVSFTEVSAELFSEMIRKTSFSISYDESRHHLSGVFFECDGSKAVMVSTDGHRLSKVERALGKGPVLEKGVIIPRKGISEIKKLIENLEGTCDIGFGKGAIFVRAQDMTLSVTLVDGQFPPYQQVIPKESDKKVIVDRYMFLESLKRVSIVTSDRNHGTRLDIEKDGVLRMTCENPDLGEAQEEVKTNYKGARFTIGLNAKYLIDLLTEIQSERVVVEFNRELDPIMVHPEESSDYLCVVMPMRI